MKTKLARVLRQNRIPTARLIASTKRYDPRGRGYSRTYVYGVCRGAIRNPSLTFMSTVLEATRVLAEQPELEVGDLFDFSTGKPRRKAS